MVEPQRQRMGWMERKPGFTGFWLKIIALVLMTADHIGLFFAFAGAPVWLRWLGRLSAPLFFFLLAQGFVHTRSRIRYLSRLYGCSVGMYLLDALLNRFFPRPDGLLVDNNIFATLFLTLLLLCLGDWAKDAVQKKQWLWLTGLGGCFFLFFLAPSLFLLLPDSLAPLKTALAWLFPGPFAVEGGIAFLLLGMGMVWLRENRLAFCLMYLVISLSFLLTGTGDPLFFNYQWMMAFALPVLLCYNGERGRGCKGLFYSYYPLHIAFLFIASGLFYAGWSG